MSDITIKKVTVRRGTDHITIKYVEEGVEKTLIISAREVVRNEQKQMLELAKSISVSHPHPRVG